MYIRKEDEVDEGFTGSSWYAAIDTHLVTVTSTLPVRQKPMEPEVNATIERILATLKLETLENDMAHAIYAKLIDGPISVADLVRELRLQWNETHEVSEIHVFVRDVVKLLLLHPDVEAGNIHEGRFVPLDVWFPSAEEQIDSVLRSNDKLWDDGARFVFRRKTA